MGILDRVGTGEYQIPDRLDPARTDLRDEFMADPLGRHSLGIAGRRGEPTLILPGRVFTDQAEAERYVFDLRWQALTSPDGTHDDRADGDRDA
jgi:hypothetical protein